VATVGGEALFQENERWWLTEGIAEYIQEDGRALGRYDGRYSVRRYLRERTWRGDLDGLTPADKDKDWEVGAKYGLAYYGTRCIGDRFGRDKLLEFVDMVLRNSLNAEVAADSVLGKPWATVEKDCLAYTREAAG
jgi:hypothetical protein